MIPSISRFVLTLAACLATHAAFAREEERSWHLGIALGQGSRENPLISGENIAINAVIDFSWYGDRFFFDNGDLGYTFLEKRNFSFSLIATVNNERNFYNYLTGRQLSLDSLLDNRFNFGTSITDSTAGTTVTDPDTGKVDVLPDGPGITGLLPDPARQNQDVALPDRDFALNSGMEFLYVSPMGDIQAQILTDVSALHDGQEAWLSWSYPWFTHNGQFNLTLGAEWKSGDLATYYFGVTPEESFNGRPMKPARAPIPSSGFLPDMR
jgi:outer membrane protein